MNPIPPKGEIRYDNKGSPIWHICGRAFDKLGQHVYNRHDMSANEYKEMFGLDRRLGLTSSNTKKKVRLQTYKRLCVRTKQMNKLRILKDKNE